MLNNDSHNQHSFHEPLPITVAPFYLKTNESFIALQVTVWRSECVHKLILKTGYSFLHGRLSVRNNSQTVPTNIMPNSATTLFFCHFDFALDVFLRATTYWRHKCLNCKRVDIYVGMMSGFYIGKNNVFLADVTTLCSTDLWRLQDICVYC